MSLNKILIQIICAFVIFGNIRGQNANIRPNLNCSSLDTIDQLNIYEYQKCLNELEYEGSYRKLYKLISKIDSIVVKEIIEDQIVQYESLKTSNQLLRSFNEHLLSHNLEQKLQSLILSKPALLENDFNQHVQKPSTKNINIAQFINEYSFYLLSRKKFRSEKFYKIDSIAKNIISSKVDISILKKEILEFSEHDYLMGEGSKFIKTNIFEVTTQL